MFHGWYVMGPMCIFFSFLARRTSPKEGLLMVYIIYIRGLPCQCSSKFQVVCWFVRCVLFFSSFHSSTEYKNCAKLYKSGKRIGGVYKINPDGAGPDFEVLCDQTPAGGGWTMA